jgi:hypothetical protein
MRHDVFSVRHALRAFFFRREPFQVRFVLRAVRCAYIPRTAFWGMAGNASEVERNEDRGRRNQNRSCRKPPVQYKRRPKTRKCGRTVLSAFRAKTHMAYRLRLGCARWRTTAKSMTVCVIRRQGRARRVSNAIADDDLSSDVQRRRGRPAVDVMGQNTGRLQTILKNVAR